jgi:serine/threonine protein kinase
MESSFGSSLQSALYTVDGKTYNEDKSLGSGAQGNVRELAPTEKDAPSLALKTGSDIRNEIKAYKEVGEHKNVLKYVGETETPKGPGLITEKASGGNLDEAFKELRKMYADEGLGHSDYVGTVQHLLGGTTEGLAHVASKDVVHRDIKPSNVLLDSATKEAKLGDFGLASKNQTYLMKRGTADFMPMDDDYASPKSDVYSLGATAYEAMGKDAVAAPYDDQVIQTGQTGVGSAFHKFVAHTTGDAAARPTAQQARSEPFLDDPLVDPDRAKRVLQKMLDRRDGVIPPPAPAPEQRPEPTPEHREKYSKVMQEIYNGQY